MLEGEERTGRRIHQTCTNYASCSSQLYGKSLHEVVVVVVVEDEAIGRHSDRDFDKEEQGGKQFHSIRNDKMHTVSIDIDTAISSSERLCPL